jgi:hypothetical protein
VEPRFCLRAYLCAFVAASVFFVEVRAQNLPFAFEQNRKQAHESVRFLARTPAYQVNLKRGEVEIAFHSRSLLIRFAGSAKENAKPEGYARLDDLIRYVHTNKSDDSQKIPKFALVRYTDLYPGIELVFYGRRGHVEYEFVIAPESDPNQIRLALHNADQVEIDETGGLAISIGGETLRMKKPVAIQHDDGATRLIDIRYRLAGANEVSLEISDYNRALPLTVR